MIDRLLLGTGGLATGYVLVAALLLILLLRTRWSWRIKSVAILLASAFCILAYESWPAILGWPSGSDLPPKFNLVAVHVQPPEEITGTEGAIYLWITEIGRRGAPPRAYRLPWEPLLREKVVRAQERLGKNLPQVGERREEEEGPPGARLIGTGQLGQKSAKLEFYDLPAPPLPEK
jgi:hypothetical protein